MEGRVRVFFGLMVIRMTLVVIAIVASLNALADPQEAMSQLYVRGEAQLMVAPDQVSVSLGVMSESANVKKAIADNSKKMQALERALRLLGLSSDEYQTQQFRVQPVWSSRPNNAGSGWKPSIIGYRVNNRLLVTTTKIASIGDIIAKTTAAGANQVHSMSFGLSNPRQYRAQAITQAMKNAKEDAQTLAAASGDRIVRTLSLNLDNTVASNVHIESEAFMKTSRLMADQASSIAPPIVSGDVMVSASVSVTYELDSLE